MSKSINLSLNLKRGVIFVAFFVIAVAVAISGMAGTDSKASDERSFGIESSSFEPSEGRLTIELQHDVPGAEFAAEPMIHINGSTHLGAISLYGDTVTVEFEEMVESPDTAVLEFPAVSLPVSVTTTQSAQDGTLEGPDGHRYIIKEQTLDEVHGHLNLEYEPVDDDAPAITRAEIRTDSSSIEAIGFGTRYSPGLSLREGVLTFPIEAESLSVSNDAQIVIEQFRSMTAFQIDVEFGDE